ncbi:MAG: IS21 family transposase [Bacteroidales bacterium]|nr:IS21 family transposase [Bacteroidales bacterium]
MLTMDQIQNIRFLRKFKGLSLRSVAKETGHHFETVQKYLEKDDFNLQLREKQQRKGKLDPFKELIDQWLKDDLSAKHKQRHTAKRIYDRLKKLYKDDFDASDRSIRKYVAKRRPEILGADSGYLPLEHSPGEAQVDFGSAQFYERGTLYDGFHLVLSFPHSNAGYLQVFKSENQECLLEGLKNIFGHIGGCPREIWFDNASTIVNALRRDGMRDVNKGFQRFMLHYNFMSNFCNPNSGHEKGNVENKVGYTRRNQLVPIPEFNDIREFNRQLLTNCDQDMQRNHYKKTGTIAQLFAEDKKALHTLPPAPFEVYRLERVKADNYGKVKDSNRRYSSSPAFAGRQLWLKTGAFEVVLLDDKYQEIIRHSRLYGQQTESMQWGPYLELMARRPRAVKYTGFFKELPAELQDYLEECDLTAKRAALQVLSKMVKSSDLTTATTAFKDTLKRGLKDLDSIWSNYIRLTSGSYEMELTELLPKVPELAPYQIDTSVYDLLLKGGGHKWRQ